MVKKGYMNDLLSFFFRFIRSYFTISTRLIYESQKFYQRRLKDGRRFPLRLPRLRVLIPGDFVELPSDSAGFLSLRAARLTALVINDSGVLVRAKASLNDRQPVGFSYPFLDFIES